MNGVLRENGVRAGVKGVPLVRADMRETGRLGVNGVGLSALVLTVGTGDGCIGARAWGVCAMSSAMSLLRGLLRVGTGRPEGGWTGS